MTIQSGSRSHDLAVEIAQKVIQMSDAEVDALIASRGLTHLAHPDRIAAILGMAPSDAPLEETEDDIKSSVSSIDSLDVGEADQAQAPSPKRAGQGRTRR